MLHRFDLCSVDIKTYVRFLKQISFRRMKRSYNLYCSRLIVCLAGQRQALQTAIDLDLPSSARILWFQPGKPFVPRSWRE